MFEPVASRKDLVGTGVEVLRAFVSANVVQISFPGHSGQNASVELALVAHGKSLSLFSLYWLHQDQTSSLMRFENRINGDANGDEAERAFQMGVDYLESMGFLMEPKTPPTNNPQARAAFWSGTLRMMGWAGDASLSAVVPPASRASGAKAADEMENASEISAAAFTVADVGQAGAGLRQEARQETYVQNAASVAVSLEQWQVWAKYLASF